MNEASRDVSSDVLTYIYHDIVAFKEGKHYGCLESSAVCILFLKYAIYIVTEVNISADISFKIPVEHSMWQSLSKESNPPFQSAYCLYQ